MKFEFISLKRHLLRIAVGALLAVLALMVPRPAMAQLVNGSFIKGCNLAWS
jgi:hypothetical protein